MDLLTQQSISLIDRANVLERVANELRVEAAAVGYELGLLRKYLQNDMVIRRVRKYFNARTFLRRSA
jgi:hypothetical protein